VPGWDHIAKAFIQQVLNSLEAQCEWFFPRAGGSGAGVLGLGREAVVREDSFTSWDQGRLGVCWGC
jgi:hypothetical protein